MNRLVIIGNGFDLFHGLKTSYTDFIMDLFVHGGNKTADAKYGDKNPTLLRPNSNPENRVSVKQVEALFAARNKPIRTFYNQRFLDDYAYVASKIIRTSLTAIAEKGWTDIEATYYRLLLESYEDTEKHPHINNKIEDLNKDLGNIKECLAIYLREQIQEYKNLPDLHTTPLSFKYRKKAPELVFIANFNYTMPYSDDFLWEWEYPTFFTLFSVNIHGTIIDSSKAMIFGYGDETDENYHKIENAGNDEYLKHFKSYRYTDSANYTKLADFVDSDQFEVMILGHSCGRSDRVLLGEIFNHDNCKGIEICYHKFPEGGDTFNEVKFNIGRTMPDKVAYRRKIIPKAHCRTIAEVHGEKRHKDERTETSASNQLNTIG